MRPRKEIEDEQVEYSHWDDSVRGLSGTMDLIVEILLDIRDLLDKNQPKTRVVHPVSAPPPKVT